MKLGIPRESVPGETRVAATPDTVKKYRALGLEVIVESDAGSSARISDDDYVAAGAQVSDQATALAADVVLKVRCPSEAEIAAMQRGSVVISFIDTCGDNPLLSALAAQGVDAIAMELIPRISRAQSMDALSSQANIAGYRAVIEGTGLYNRFLPLMMTAAGSAKPAQIIVLGAGVAGLQAIATARRLGAQVSAFDVRPQVREEIASLGAKFVELDIGESGEGSGGYAKELSEDARRRQIEQLGGVLAKMDIVITTAQIPCRPAPTLITEEAVRSMRDGSVIVDLAAASGGNCPLTEADKTVEKHGVIIYGPTNLPGSMAPDASSFYSRNLLNLMPLVVDGKEGGVSRRDLLEDEITAAATVSLNGEVRDPRAAR